MTFMVVILIAKTLHIIVQIVRRTQSIYALSPVLERVIAVKQSAVIIATERTLKEIAIALTAWYNNSPRSSELALPHMLQPPLLTNAAQTSPASC